MRTINQYHMRKVFLLFILVTLSCSKEESDTPSTSNQEPTVTRYDVNITSTSLNSL